MRRQDVWRSVITQQLQADSLAVEMAAQLLELARHHEAKLYYSTMAADEARHVEAWLRLIEAAGGPTERDPHLDKLAQIFLGLDVLEEKVFLMQVFFERMIIPRFRPDRPRLPRDGAGGSLQPAHDRRRNPPRLRHGLREDPAARCLQEDEGRDDQGREQDAPDLRPARHVAPEGRGASSAPRCARGTSPGSAVRSKRESRSPRRSASTSPTSSTRSRRSPG